MLDIARSAARKAGEKIISRRYTKYSVERKGSAYNVVTAVDKESERIILESLQQEYPDDDFLTEETKKEKLIKGSSRRWVIDPIDGTGPFKRGLPDFGVSIGLLENGEPILGVLNFPVLGEEYYAEKGKGAFLNKEKIKVSSVDNLEEALVGFDWHWPGNRRKDIKEIISPLADKVGYMVSYGCTIRGVAMVADGRFGAYIHWAYPWDYVAGAAILMEAGGKITDYRGNPINWLADDMSVLASNGLVHGQILSLINK